MFNKSVGLVLVSFVMKSSFAAVVNHGVILDHQEWVTGNATIQVKERPHHGNKKLLKLLSKKDNATNLNQDRVGVLLLNRIDQGIEGTIDTDTEIGGFIEAYVENYTSKTKIYSISTEFCITAITDLGTNNCYRSTYKVELDPNGLFELDVRRNFTYNFSKTGEYQAGFFITAQSEGEPTAFATYDLSYIHIDD